MLIHQGWVECVGCADRSAYDLSQHTKATGVRLVAEKKLAEPKTVDVVEIASNKAAIGKIFKREAKDILAAIGKLNEPEAVAALESLEQSLKTNNEMHLEVTVNETVNTYQLTPEMVQVKRYQKVVHVEEFVPNVIEPSFGIGRIMYSIFEHNFRVRSDDGQRTVRPDSFIKFLLTNVLINFSLIFSKMMQYFSLPPVVAPLKCSLLPLSNNADFIPFLTQLSKCSFSNRIHHDNTYDNCTSNDVFDD